MVHMRKLWRHVDRGASSIKVHHQAGACRPVWAADESWDDEQLGGGHDAGRGGNPWLRPAPTSRSN